MNILLLIIYFVIIILIVFCLGVIVLEKIGQKRMYLYRSISYWKRVNSKKHIQMQETLDFVYNKLLDSGYKPFLTFGTLMGSIRHKTFVPWDDDIDLGIYVPDKKDIKRVQSHIIHIFKKHHWKVDNLLLKLFAFIQLSKGERCIDIFIVTDLSNNQVGYDNVLKRISTPKHYFYKEELLNLSYGIINSKKYLIPSNTVNVLKRQYSKNVMKKFLLTHVHLTHVHHNNFLSTLIIFNRTCFLKSPIVIDLP